MYNYSYFYYFVIDCEAWVLNDNDGCLLKFTPMKNYRDFNYLLVARLWGYLYRQFAITYFKLFEMYGYAGNEYEQAFIFLYVYLTSLDSNGGLPKARV